MIGVPLVGAGGEQAITLMHPQQRRRRGDPPVPCHGREPVLETIRFPAALHPKEA